MADQHTGAVALAHDLGRFGTGPALIVPGADGRVTTLTYADLEERVDDATGRLGHRRRRLVQLETDGSADAIVTYLGALRGGHPVVVTAPRERPDDEGSQLAAYRPGARAGRDATGAWTVEVEDGPIHDGLHPDLALLLSTSGSTGSAKLVRLSGRNIMANARSITSYLRLDADDRAITTLPMHYCYGLSVIHTHLLVGASMVVSDLSVVDPCFWNLVDDQQITGFAGVPHTFDLLDRIGFDQMEVPGLRYLTQAGGRLDPERVRTYAELGRQRGWELFVMYGQTEATARMAYLPPSMAAANPATIGVAVDGGSFTIDRTVLDDGERQAWGDDVGELVYRGPNVMMGYATCPADLALGHTTPELRTGDLARVTPTGLHEIVGRRSRFVKLFGLRIDLEQVERMVAAVGIRCWCTGDDHRLVIATVDDPPAHLATEIATRLGIPPGVIEVTRFDTDIPRLPSGKPDYVAIRAHGSHSAPTTIEQAPESVADVFRAVLGRREVDASDTFVGLGGDSLSYVEVSIQIERILGSVPRGWPTMTVAQLDTVERRSSTLRHVEGSVAFRAAAITFIVGTHFGAYRVPSGAFILLCIAGLNFARFQLGTVVSTASVRPILTTVVRILVPSLIAAVLFNPSVTAGSLVLVESYVEAGTSIYGLWFVEVLIHLLLVCAALLAVPWSRRRQQRDPFRFAAALTAATVALRFAAIPLWRADSPDLKVTHNVAWIFALGWMIHAADTTRRRLICSAVAILGFAGIAEHYDMHVVAVAGTLALIWIPAVVVPPPVHLVVGALASASLYIYLIHYPASSWVPDGHPVVRTAVALTAGVVIWWLVERLPSAVVRSRRRGCDTTPAPLERAVATSRTPRATGVAG